MVIFSFWYRIKCKLHIVAKKKSLLYLATLQPYLLSFSFMYLFTSCFLCLEWGVTTHHYLPSQEIMIRSSCEVSLGRIYYRAPFCSQVSDNYFPLLKWNHFTKIMKRRKYSHFLSSMQKYFPNKYLIKTKTSPVNSISQVLYLNLCNYQFHGNCFMMIFNIVQFFQDKR